MAYFLFVDESGQDHRESPYEVLAGVSIEDRDLWNLIQSLNDLETRIFGRRYSDNIRELKGTKLLNSKTFRKAAQMPPIPVDERRELARACIESGDGAGRLHITALAQAKLAYVEEVLKTCGRYRCRAFASIIAPMSPRPERSHLRKDYAYIFERFFYYLEDRPDAPSGIVVFDETEKSQSHMLLDQMSNYFTRTSNGQSRAALIIPEPFFVHSDLTTGVQLADLVAYIVSWGVRYGNLQAPSRPELETVARIVKNLRYKALRDGADGKPYTIWSFVDITDLRPKSSREIE